MTVLDILDGQRGSQNWPKSKLAELEKKAGRSRKNWFWISAFFTINGNVCVSGQGPLQFRGVLFGLLFFWTDISKPIAPLVMIFLNGGSSWRRSGTFASQARPGLWVKRGDSAELVLTQPVFDPIDALDAGQVVFVWTGYATGFRFGSPNYLCVSYSSASRICRASSYIICRCFVGILLVHVGWSDIRHRRQRQRVRTSTTSSLSFGRFLEPGTTGGQAREMQRQGKFDRIFGIRKFVIRSRSRHGVSRRRSLRVSMVFSRLSRNYRSLRRGGVRVVPSTVPAKKQPCQDYQRGRPVSQKFLPKVRRLHPLWPRFCRLLVPPGTAWGRVHLCLWYPICSPPSPSGTSGLVRRCVHVSGGGALLDFPN